MDTRWATGVAVVAKTQTGIKGEQVMELMIVSGRQAIRMSGSLFTTKPAFSLKARCYVRKNADPAILDEVSSEHAASRLKFSLVAPEPASPSQAQR